MEILLKLRGGTDPSGRLVGMGSAVVADVSQALRQLGGEVYAQMPESQPHTRGGLASPTEIVIALGSAGAFTALYQILCKFLERNKDRVLTLERNDVKLILKGHSMPEEKDPLDQLVPELDSQPHNK